MRAGMMATLLASLSLASAAMAQQVAPRSVQQDFDAATVLDAGTDAAAALAAWEALERRTVANRRSHAIMLVRKSAALLRLARLDEALAAARVGLVNLPAGDATLAQDRFDAQINIARIEHSALDYGNAVASFRAAAAIAPTPIERLVALLGLVETETFVDSDAALADLARLEPLTTATDVQKPARGRVAMAKAVLLLNRNDAAGARDAAIRAVSLYGGMTDRTSLADVSARSTAALASLLAGNEEDARRYMAMTGAGRLSKGSFNPASQIVVPDCGGEAGLKPDDMAVIEFSIGDDGRVFSSQPIYAAGGGAVALEFARAARGWSWSTEQLKEVPAFFRYNARVELRCNLGFDRPSPTAPIDDALAAWMATKGLTAAPPINGSAAAALVTQRAALAKAEAGGAAGLAALPPIAAIIDNPVLSRDEAHALAERGLAIVRAADAPPLVRLDFDLTARRTASADRWRTGALRRQIDALIADPVYAADPGARAAIRVIGADREDNARAASLLRQVADDAALPANHPYKVAALVRLASLAQAAGDQAAARAAFAQSGLAPSQCALLDREPKLQHVGGSFPMEAMRWGFEGWTRVQYDIGADGKVLNQRALVSYPPFIFTKAGSDTMKGAVYAKTYRPDGGLGCGATTTNVKFLMPK